MNAKNIFEEASVVRTYRLDKFGQNSLSILEKEHMNDKFSEFKQNQPRIFNEIITNELDWEKFKQMAEMAFSLHLQLHSNMSSKEARSVRFS